MADGKVKIETELDDSGAKRGLSNLESTFKKSFSGMDKIGSLAFKGATTAIKGTAVAIGAVTTAAAGAGIAAVKIGSEFESQMSRVQAISGATGEEFEQLRELAIQLGADTAFSASSAAEGMENLAAAGFATNEIMDAMPGMLDLAAASGEDLAVSADIAASTLRGFGLEADQAAHVADVLAMNANKTNSSVADTGEAMKYVAPLAKAAGISFEETAAAIGIMANAGIQGSQAGTTLRGALSRLSKPTKDMKEAMSDLGISFYDSEGKMKSLSEQVGMLRKATAGMTDEQRNNYLVTLYGQEALSGMLALINEGEGALQDLTKAYEKSDGAAKKTAEIMQDNLSGALEELGGSAETLGILFYDSIAGNLKKTVQSVTKSVNKISDAFKKGGIDKAVKQAGKEFANLATEAAKGAPKMVNVSIDFINSFVAGIAQNKGQLLAAAGDITNAIVDGLIQLLPSRMQEPVRQAIDAMSESFTSGGLSSAIETTGNLFNGLIDIVSSLAKTALPLLVEGLDFTAENLDIIVPLLTAAAAGYVAYNTAVMAVENATKLATAAQTLWNTAMSLSPVGLLVGSIAALATGIAVASAAQKDSNDVTAEANRQLAEQAEKIRETQKARQEAVAEIETEYGYYQQLWNELQGIVDQNGRVKQGYEERAAFITSTLSDALGVEITQTDGVIQKYGELQSSIGELIEKKRQEAILSTYEESYTTALKNRQEAQAELARTYSEYQAALEEVNALEQEYNRLAEEARNGNTLAAMDLENLTMKQNDANEALQNSKYAYEDARTAFDEYESVIMNYETAVGAVQSGSATAEAAIQALTDGLIRASGANETELAKQVDTWKQKYEEMRAAAEAGNTGITDTMVQGAQAMWLMSQIEFEKGTTNNKSVIEAYQAELAALFQASPAKEAASTSGRETMEAHAQGIESVDVNTPVANKLNEESTAWTANNSATESQAKASGTETAQAHVQGIEEVDTATPAGEKGAEAGQYLADAAEAQQAVVEAAGRDLVNAILNGMSQSDATSLMQQLGQQIVSGLSEGITSNQGLVQSSVNSLVDLAKSTLTGANLSTTAQQEGTKATTQMQNAITSGTPGVRSAVNTLCNLLKQTLVSARIWNTAKDEGTKATTQMKSAITSGTPGVVSAVRTLCTNSINTLKSAQLPTKFKTEATNMMRDFTSAITQSTPLAVAASRDMATQVYNALKSVALPAKGKTEGANFGKGLVSGINAQRGSATSAGSALGTAAKNGLNSANLYSAGYSIGAQLCNGIAAGISANAGAAAAAAASAAASAAAAARANLQIHSPSRVGIEIGRMFDKGIEEGIIQNTDGIEMASANLSEKIKNSVDTKSGYDSGKNLAKRIWDGFDKNNPFNNIQRSLDVGVRGLQTSVLSGAVTTNNQTNNFYGMQTPDQVARQLRLQQIYGLAGAR